MKEEKNVIDTNDKIVKNFNEEQLRIYNMYKNNFSYDTKFPLEKEDMEIEKMEKAYKIMKIIFKMELILVAAVLIFGITVGKLPFREEEPQIKYGKVLNFEIEKDVF